jgi:hypothetical protein
MEDFFHLRPPLPLFTGRKGLLTGFADRPPLLSDGVGSHLFHVFFVIISGIFKVTEEVPLMVEDGVILDVAFFDGF